MKHLIKARSLALAAMKANANIFEIKGHFIDEARARGWPNHEIEKIMQRIETGTYTEALALMEKFYEKSFKESLRDL